MSKMNYSELIEKLKEAFSDSVEDFAYDNGFEKSDFPEIGEYKKINSYGGEGKGSTWHVVYYFKEHDIYIRVDGYYSSYEGASFDDGWSSCREVKPKEKTITVYE